QMNSMAGGGRKGEVNEDGLDKMIDFIQEHALHKGDQSDESAAEQFKDERIADAIRASYQQVTGHQLPIKDKN
ncbi:uncharacterized protein STEHIDRAFT_65129, partial [Stereum hirsutum FP-91666 SS1]|uniref:uncharacterized protein n=1 Tax=Stereum hirsutum (strain FP-91666) TaxID=721885 RepID=UPI000444A70D